MIREWAWKRINLKENKLKREWTKYSSKNGIISWKIIKWYHRKWFLNIQIASIHLICLLKNEWHLNSRRNNTVYWVYLRDIYWLWSRHWTRFSTYKTACIPKNAIISKSNCNLKIVRQQYKKRCCFFVAVQHLEIPKYSPFFAKLRKNCKYVAVHENAVKTYGWTRLKQTHPIHTQAMRLASMYSEYSNKTHAQLFNWEEQIYRHLTVVWWFFLSVRVLVLVFGPVCISYMLLHLCNGQILSHYTVCIASYLNEYW